MSTSSPTTSSTPPGQSILARSFAYTALIIAALTQTANAAPILLSGAINEPGLLPGSQPPPFIGDVLQGASGPTKQAYPFAWVLRESGEQPLCRALHAAIVQRISRTKLTLHSALTTAQAPLSLSSMVTAIHRAQRDRIPSDGVVAIHFPARTGTIDVVDPATGDLYTLPWPDDGSGSQLQQEKARNPYAIALLPQGAAAPLAKLATSLRDIPPGSLVVLLQTAGALQSCLQSVNRAP